MQLTRLEWTLAICLFGNLIFLAEIDQVSTSSPPSGRINISAPSPGCKMQEKLGFTFGEEEMKLYGKTKEECCLQQCKESCLIESKCWAVRFSSGNCSLSFHESIFKEKENSTIFKKICIQGSPSSPPSGGSTSFAPSGGSSSAPPGGSTSFAPSGGSSSAPPGGSTSSASSSGSRSLHSMLTTLGALTAFLFI